MTASATMPSSVLRVQDRLTWNEELITNLLAIWTLVGVFLDGWAHSKYEIIDTFFTPWHGVFYSGFLAMTLWIAWCVIRNHQAGMRWRDAIPTGYSLAIVGLGIFALGAIGDFSWHELFGAEVAGERLASPAHLLLFVGGLLVITAPLRAAWAADPEGFAPSLKQFLPTLLSMTLCTTAASYLLLNVWGFRSAELLGTAQLQALLAAVAQSPAVTRTMEVMVQTRVFGSLLLTNLLLLTPVLLMVRRWRIPFGSITILFTTVVAAMNSLTEFRMPEVIAVAFVSGLAADVLVKVLQPSQLRVAAFRILATAAPAVLWGVYSVGTSARWGLTVSPDLWLGGIFFAAVSGFGLSLAMVPCAPKDSAR
ncbi:MAG TPA: hypothetical protein VGK88_00080 [bacterium]|jgi:hypothetical protein